MSSSELESKKKVKAPKEPKEPKAPRAKKQQPNKEETLKMLKEETLKMLLDTSNELKQIILDSKDDEMKVNYKQFRREDETKTKYNE